MGSFTINPRELRAALRFAGFAIQRFNTVPILANVLVEPGENGAVTFRSTDLDLEMFATVSCEHQGFDAFTIRPGFFHDMIRFADGPATFEVDGETLRARCDDMSASARILCPAADWPALVIDSTSEVNTEISEAVLHKALSAVRPCISTEETRYYLNGAYIHPIERQSLRRRHRWSPVGPVSIRCGMEDPRRHLPHRSDQRAHAQAASWWERHHQGARIFHQIAQEDRR